MATDYPPAEILTRLDEHGRVPLQPFLGPVLNQASCVWIKEQNIHLLFHTQDAGFTQGIVLTPLPAELDEFRDRAASVVHMLLVPLVEYRFVAGGALGFESSCMGLNVQPTSINAAFTHSLGDARVQVEELGDALALGVQLALQRHAYDTAGIPSISDTKMAKLFAERLAKIRNGEIDTPGWRELPCDTEP